MIDVPGVVAPPGALRPEARPTEAAGLTNPRTADAFLARGVPSLGDAAMRDVPATSRGGRQTIYLSGAGGMGNIGAEAIFLALIRLYQRYWPDARFIVSAWRPKRVKALLAGLPGDFQVVTQGVSLDRPCELRAADVFVVCGDVALTETVVPILPAYLATKALWARVFGARIICLGIEVEPIRRALNRWMIRRILNRIVRYYVVRNEASHKTLAHLSTEPATLLLGCEPALMIADDDLRRFPAPLLEARGAELFVGFSVRDYFAEPLRVDFWRMRLCRRDARPGTLSPAMEQTVRFLAHEADRLIERYGARVVFIPHHCLTGAEQVILTDREIAQRIVQCMRRPESTTIVSEELHPFAVMNIYRAMDLVVSMRHHATSFAYRFGVPTVGCAISEKIIRHFRQIKQEALLVDPLDPDFSKTDRVVDYVLQNRHALSADLKNHLRASQLAMRMAMDVVMGRAEPEGC